MPANQFIDRAYTRTVGGEDQIVIGILCLLKDSSGNDNMRGSLRRPLGA